MASSSSDKQHGHTAEVASSNSHPHDASNRNQPTGEALMSNGDRAKKVLYMSYSPDTTSLSVGSSHGYEIYNIDKYGRFTLEFHEVLENDVVIVERLNNSALVCLVVDSHPCHMKVFHFRKQRTICQYSYSNRIKRILLNSRRVVVKTEDRLYVHGMKNLNIACTLKELPSDSDVLSLCAYEKRSFIAIPWAQETGKVRIYDSNELKDVNYIDAHQSPLAQLKFDRHGNRLATASFKGTVVRVFDVHTRERVFDVHTRERVHELRRGVSNAVMYSLSFSQCGNFLAACSSANTVHVFKVPNLCTHSAGGSAGAVEDDDSNSSSSKESSGASVVPGLGFMAAISDMMKATAGLVMTTSEERSVAKIELDKSLQIRHDTILTYLEQGFYAMVTSYSGTVALYCIDPMKNFETIFVNVVSLTDLVDKSNAEQQASAASAEKDATVATTVAADTNATVAAVNVASNRPPSRGRQQHQSDTVNSNNSKSVAHSSAKNDDSKSSNSNKDGPVVIDGQGTVTTTKKQQHLPRDTAEHRRTSEAAAASSGAHKH